MVLGFGVAYGIITSENGNIIDPMEPSVSTVLTLLGGPELTRKRKEIIL